MPGLFGGLLARLSGQGNECNRIECLPPNLRQLAIKYRNAIANVLGLPPEAIREDVVVKWVQHWVHAYVKPEYWSRLRALLYSYEPRVNVLSSNGEKKIWVIY